MSDRLGPIPLEDMSAAQRAAAQEIIDGPRGAVVGPFVPLLRSPELMGLAQRMGEYLRYRSAIGAWIAHSTCWFHWRAVTRIASSDKRTPIALR